MMKKIVVLFSVLLLSVMGFAQNKVLFSSANGERFYLFLDGVRINNRALNSVSIDKVKPGPHNVEISFESDHSKVKEIIDIPPYNAWYDFVVDAGGIWLYGAYSKEFMDAHPDIFGGEIPSQSVNNGKDKDININISVNQTQVNNQTNVQNTQTGTSQSNQSGVVPPPPPPPAPVQYTNCAAPVNPAEFNAFLMTLKDKPFDDTKKTIVKQFVKNNCVSSSQLSLILGELDYESSKLEIAKFAYIYIYDPDNYYLINNAFDFSSSVDELNKYIEKVSGN